MKNSIASNEPMVVSAAWSNCLGEVEPDAIDATFKKGVLKLVFKKTQASQAKRIEIKTG